MAQPIEMKPSVIDARAALQQRLLNAPAEHAEALLAGYELLQGLHDRGVIDFLRGAVGSSEKVLDIVVDATKTPGSIRGIRNLMILVNMLSAIDPETLSRSTRAVPIALQAIGEEPESLGLWRLMKDFLWNQQFRRGLAVINKLIEALGNGPSGAPAAKKQS
jgi:uncharacterized protein YjgD (DUF1641 family)